MSTSAIRDALERLIEAAERVERTDPIDAARDALAAEPVGEGPSDEEWDALVERIWDKYETVGYQGERFMYGGDFGNALDLVRKELPRWGRPAAPPAPETPAEVLAARPLLEQVARLGDCIGANTVGQIMAISSRAAAWLRENPPGQPVAIEPRGCPTPGACSCVEPAPPAAYIDPEVEDADRQLLEVFFSQLGRGLEVPPETLLRGIRGVRAFRFTSCSSRLSPAEVQQIIEALDFCIGDSDDRANSANHHRLRQRLKRLIATFPTPSGSSTTHPAAPPAPEPGEVGELVAMLRRNAHWKRVEAKAPILAEHADRIDRAATLLEQQQHLLKLACQELDNFMEQQQAAPAPAVAPVASEWENGFMGGVCVALATVTAHGASTVWREIVRSVGVDNLLNYAANVSPVDWDLAGFSEYAQPELGKGKPLPPPQAGEGEA